MHTYIFWYNQSCNSSITDVPEITVTSNICGVLGLCFFPDVTGERKKPGTQRKASKMAKCAPRRQNYLEEKDHKEILEGCGKDFVSERTKTS
jgi:hypothetical protein